MKNKIPYYFSSWRGRPFEQLHKDLITNKYKRLYCLSIAAINGTYYGYWDVIAWKGKRTIFIEAKRSKNDRLSNTQKKWLQSGLEAGLKPDNFLKFQSVIPGFVFAVSLFNYDCALKLVGV